MKIVGDTKMFELLCSETNEKDNAIKTIKAMEVLSGCVINITTTTLNKDGSSNVAEALTFVPGMRIVEDINGGKKLIPNNNILFS